MMHPMGSVRLSSVSYLYTHRFFFVSAAAVLSLLFSFFFTQTVFAAEYITTDPVIIDGSGKPREILKYTVTVKNTLAIPLTVYPSVSSVDAKTGDLSPSELDEKNRSEILGNWIAISHAGTAIPPGGKQEFPVLVQIDMGARPGNYHAHLNFNIGSTRADAEMGTNGGAHVLVNITVQDDANERLQLASFIPDRNFFTGSAAAFSYKIENIGNRGIVPKGKIHIYDRKGAEVSSVDLNDKGVKLEPNSAAELASVWVSTGEFGRYKALLEIDYGRGTLTDTVFFWVMPWGKLLTMFAGLMAASVIVALLLHARALAGRMSPLPAGSSGRNARRVRSRFRVFSAHTLERVSAALRRNNDNDLGDYEPSPAPLVERGDTVEPPADREKSRPRITHASSLSPHAVTLSPLPTARPDPRHVVDLKKVRQ